MKTVAYRCPRCEQPFTFASPSAARQNPSMSDARADDHVVWPLHVCRSCGQYLCNPEAALNAPRVAQRYMSLVTG